jgi:hypothetical protein
MVRPKSSPLVGVERFCAELVMDSLLVTLFAYLLFAVLPFKLAAAWFGAERDNWNSCFVALVFNSILGGGALALLGGGLTVALFGTFRGVVALIPALLITGLSNRFFLGTTFWRGVAITVVGALVIPGTFLAAFTIATEVRT